MQTQREVSSALPNILFILLDALRHDFLSCYDGERVETPNIDRLAREGVLLADCFSVTNVTEASLTSIFSGLYPSQHGIRNQGPKMTEQEVKRARSIRFLPEILGDLGYQTMAVDWLGRWHRRGYDRYLEALNQAASPAVRGIQGLAERFRLRDVVNRVKFVNRLWSSGLLGKGFKLYDGVGTVNRIVQMLDSRQAKPFFLFAHFWDLHAPYTPPNRLVGSPAAALAHRQRMSDVLDKIQNPDWRQFIKSWTKEYEFAEDVAALYQGGVRFLDEQMGRLWQILEERGLFDNTLIILTSDHGESLLEHGIYFDHHGLYDVSVHVPVLLRYPACLPQGRRVQGLVQHTDLFPTILEVVGQSSPISAGGTSLLGAIQAGTANHRRIVFLEESHTVRRLAVRTDQYKYIWAPEENLGCRYCGISHGAREELYDLHNDPDELDNIAERNPDICAAFRKEMDKWPKLSVEQTTSLEAVSGEFGSDYDEGDREAIEQRLRALGYL